MSDLKYSKEHEWVRVEGDVGEVGFTPLAVVNRPAADDSVVGRRRVPTPGSQQEEAQPEQAEVGGGSGGWDGR